MGLGKTIQIAALLAIVQEKYAAWPFLIVAPTSLLINWKNELKKWVPHCETGTVVQSMG